jgi:predicted dehydrogenase
LSRLRKLKVGVIGTGIISNIYLKNLTEVFQTIVEVKAVADLVPELARKKAEEYKVPYVYTVDELLADPEIEIVLNLTKPAAHAPLNLRALEAGKHVYTEKPFALSLDDANQVLELAETKGLYIGCAPDTILGAGVQTCMKLINDGWIGKPYAANAVIIMGNASSGMHPNFENFLKLGGDPLLDMGPYYLTAMIAMLGPVRRVSGSAQQVNEEITVSNPNSHAFGRTVPVEAPTNISAILDFHNGAVGSFQAAKESFGYMPRMEIYGTEGNLTVPDPNFFSGPIKITFANGGTKEMPLSHPYAEDSRGIGVADMAYAIQSGRKHRASGSLARHLLEVSMGIFKSSETERHVHMQSTIDPIVPLPLGLKYNTLDA